MTDISYDTLFSVELLHKYSADGTCNDFTIVPSAATKRLLSNYRIIVKQSGNILNAWIQLDPIALASTTSKKKPFIIPEEGLKLTFFMLLNNPLFYNYTSLPAANINGNIYYFTNRNINNSNNKKFLTRVLNNYVAGAYSFEDLLVNGGTVYQSLENNNVISATADLSNKNFWRQVTYPDPNNPVSNIPDPNRFMSEEDLLSWIPSVSQMPFPKGQPVTTVITVNLAGYSGNGSYNNNLSPIIVNNPNNLPFFPLDLSVLQNGKYLLSINDSMPQTIYLNDELRNTQVFGLIDIIVESTLDTNYLILNQTAAHQNELKSPAYSIYFLNRATIWKYTLIRKTTATITDTGIYVFGTIIPPATPTTVIKSQFPIPLSETPLKTLTLDGNSPPSATPDRLSKDLTDTSPKPVLYSEIFLNY